MKALAVIASIPCVLAVALPLHAHRTSGLLQASLIEVLPTQVSVEVSLCPGTDIASRVVALLDRDRDGSLSQAEAEAWAMDFLKTQSVTLGGRPLPLDFQAVHATPLSEMDSGHSRITVLYTASLGEVASGEHTLVCANRHEPFESSYQCNGLVPKSPGVRIAGHRRDNGQRELTLIAAFDGSNGEAASTRQPTVATGPRIPPAARPWIVGLALAGMVVGTVLHGRMRLFPDHR